jgi:hypothetical protein
MRFWTTDWSYNDFFNTLGYSRKAEVRSVLMRDNLIRKHPAFEPTNEFVRKDVEKAIEKESS